MIKKGVSSIIFQKPPSELDYTDINLLVKEKICESHNIEYKEKMYGNSDEEKREMLRDITSIANAYGGYLFIGIAEDNRTGAATKVIGVENAVKSREIVNASCITSVQERITGLEVHTVDIENGNPVIVVYIPRSLRAPHMVTYRGLNQFWIRHDRQKTKMSVEEIRDKYRYVQNLAEDMYSFKEKRTSELKNQIGSSSYMILGAVPFIVQDEVVDIQDMDIRSLLEFPPGQDDFGIKIHFTPRSAKPTLNGLKVGTKDYQTLELFRNGYFEFIRPMIFDREVQDRGTGNKHPVMNPFVLIENTVSFVRALHEIRTHIGLNDPFAVYLDIYNINGTALPKNASNDTFILPWETSIWENNDLQLPLLSFDSLLEDDRVAQAIMDRLWQGFGYEEAPMFIDGKCVVPK